jgi:phosphatidate cytidylyltransferase
MSSLSQRVVTAIVLLILLAAILFWLPQPLSIVFIGAFVLTGVWEWSGFFAGGHTAIRLAYTAALLVLGAIPLVSEELRVIGPPVFYLACIWWLLLLAWMAIASAPVTKAGCALAGACCLLPAWFALVDLLGRGADGPWLFLWLLGIVAAADIGAYFVGRSIGKHKLAPSISPGKTREGLLGGLVCATLAAAVGAEFFAGDALIFAGAGVLIAIVSVVGDLTVSVFKRFAGLKDSGRLLPGHGGVMDRIDSLVAALPIFIVSLGLSGLAGS